MTRLPWLMGLFLSVTVCGLVVLLSLLASVSPTTVLFRGLTVFFLFGIFGVVLGSVLEILLMPVVVEKESDALRQEMSKDHSRLESDLGDLLMEQPPSPREETPTGQTRTEDGGESGLQPVILPRLTVENGKVITRGDSAAVS
jgi:hypothetical protein